MSMQVIIPTDLVPDRLAHAGEIGSVELAGILVAHLRTEGHLSNVLWHLSRASWPRVEAGFARLLANDLQTIDRRSLEGDMLRLICCNAGVAGRRMRPFILAVLGRALGRQNAEALIRGWDVAANRLLGA